MAKQSKILIADDEQAITVGLEAILADSGYDVEIVADGQKALDAVVSGSYGVLLADFKGLRTLELPQPTTEAAPC